MTYSFCCRYVAGVDPRDAGQIEVEMSMSKEQAFDAMTEIFGSLTAPEFESWMKEQAPEFLKDAT